MQTINKSLLKNTLTYTWFIYPLSAVILSLLWIWIFPIAKRPSAHLRLEVFVAAKVKSNKVFNKILDKYEKDQLKQINVDSVKHSNSFYGQKIKIAFSTSDIMILQKGSFDIYKHSGLEYFAPITSYVQEQVNIEESQVLDGFGISLKVKNESNYLDEYIDFEDNDYVLCFTASSPNLGLVNGEDNAKHNNALTFARYLLEGNL